MALKLVLENLDGLSDEMKTLYKQGGDGKFHLQTEEDQGMKAKIDEFRNNNIALMKEKEELEKKLSKLGDPDEITKMKKRLQDIDDQKLIEAGKLEEVVQQRTERMRADFENQVAQLTAALNERDQKLTATNQRLSEVLIDGEITKAVNSVGVVRKEAIRDILSRGRETWKLEEGVPVPKEGDRLLYGIDGKAPLTFEEWAKALITSAPFLFEGSAGGGANGGANQGGAGFKGNVDLAKLPPSERLKYAHQMQSGQK